MDDELIHHTSMSRTLIVGVAHEIRVRILKDGRAVELMIERRSESGVGGEHLQRCSQSGASGHASRLCRSRT